MKKIFIKKAKKKEISIWICAVVFTINIGTMTGCSMTKENAEAVSAQSEQSESENILPVEDSTADNVILEDTPAPEASEEEAEKEEKVEKEDKIVLKIMREGEMDEMSATLFAGEGYVMMLGSKAHEIEP